MSPFISIIIPFYGTADPVLLQRCLDSIRRQGMEEGSYEIIVVDDENRTTGGARNNGMQQAHGEYLFFVDADDVVDEKKAQELADNVCSTMDISSIRNNIINILHILCYSK